jgi:hypothetical protein
MNKKISLWAAAAVLTLGLPLHAQTVPTPPATPSEPVAAPTLAPAWEAKFDVGRRARTTESVGLRRYVNSKTAPDKLPAGTTVRLKEKEDLDGVEMWQVQPVAGLAAGKIGWVPRTALTQQWPAGPADTLVPMLGDRSAEVEKILTQLRLGEAKVRVTALKSLHASGITDERVFDTIAHELAAGLARSDEISGNLWSAIAVGVAAGLVGGVGAQAAAQGSMQNRGDPRSWKLEVIWFTKALGFSGYAKYRPLLEMAAETNSLGTGRLSSYAEQALEDLEQSARWNRVINDPAGHKADQSHAQTRLINVLRSGDRPLIRLALNEAARKKEAPLFDAVEAEFKALARQPLDDDQSDTVADMAEVLGRSGDLKYRATLADAAANASTKQVRGEAADMVEKLDASASKN